MRGLWQKEAPDSFAESFSQCSGWKNGDLFDTGTKYPAYPFSLIVIAPFVPW
jgi:hypothetical protein